MLRNVLQIPKELVDIILTAADCAVFVNIYYFGYFSVYHPVSVAHSDIEEGLLMQIADIKSFLVKEGATGIDLPVS